MIRITTININADVNYTAKKTEAKKFRGGFSEYVEFLVLSDLKKKGIQIMQFEPNVKK